jgi:hypothetical protein
MKQKTANINAELLNQPGRSFAANPVFTPKAVNLLIVLSAFLSAAPLAYLIYRINSAWTEQPEKAVQIIGLLFAALIILPPAIYLTVRRGAAEIAELGLIIVSTIGVLLVACYLFQASFYVNYPGDFLIWSESDFVNDILKFRQNYPIFTPDVNNESFTYVPGSQLTTYFLAWLVGFPTSVSAFRAIQIFYTLLSAVVAFLCCRRLIEIASPSASKILDSTIWGIVWLTGLFLIATNTITNPFNHLLHNDALAQLVTVTAYWLLLEYETTKDKRILWLMALIPALGFWVKQSLIIWAVLYVAYLLIFDAPRSFKRIFTFGLAAFGAILISISIGYWLWQDNFTYWVFTVLGAHGVSPLRSFKHLLDIWVYFAVGLLGGAILLHYAGFKKLFGHWLIWLALISIETYTSGVAWMLNHIGPGCLIAGIWFFAALAFARTKIADTTIKSSGANDWLRAGVAVAVLCLLFSGFGIVRVPSQPFGHDANRYAGEIENEFAGQSPEDILLDLGSWVYLRDGVVMKDRAPSIGERGWSQTGDFSGIRRRIEDKSYRKILMRNFNSPDFWYDHASWSRSSDIRKTLMENYWEVGRIKRVEGLSEKEMPYGFNDISILVPRTK